MSDETAPARTPSRPLPDLAAGHTVTGYDRDLTRFYGLILEMGERTVEQLRAAMAALVDGDTAPAHRVLEREPQIDRLALDADGEALRLLALRQPKAVDLRIVLALAKIADETERAADKAARIAYRALALRESGAQIGDTLRGGLTRCYERVLAAFEQAMGATAAFDTLGAVAVLEQESVLAQADRELVSLLTADGGATPSLPQLESLFAIAHALHRVGDHAASIAEHVIYVAEGQDVRFRNREILIESLKQRGGA